MKYPTYPKYKDSGVEWLGEIPEEWKVNRISSLSSDESNSFIDGDWIESPYITDSGIRLLQTGNIGIGYYKEQGFRYISVESFLELNCTEVRVGDILICRLAEPVGRACIAPDLGERMITSVDVCILKPSINICSKYFVFFFSSTVYLAYLESICRGGTRDRIARSILGAIRVPLPPFSTQQIIATFLDTETAKIDGLIKDYEELITLLQEKRQALISHAVTRGLSELVSPDDPEFGEWAKPVKFKDSGVEWLGEIPEDWEVWKVAHVFSTSSGTTPPADEDKWYGGTIPWITTGELREEEIWETEKNITTEAISRFSALKIVSPGCLIIAMYGATIGRLAINRVPATMNQACCALFPTEDISVSYSYYYFQIAKEYLVLLSTGGGQPNISQEKIRGFPIPLPSFPMQQVIASFLDSQILKIDTLISETESAVSLLKEHRSALITNAVTGKINVEALV